MPWQEEEDPAQTLAQVKDSTAEFHYFNCVTQPDHPLYGDGHIRFGEPGVFRRPGHRAADGEAEGHGILQH
jgi:hypothetical protein